VSEKAASGSVTKGNDVRGSVSGKDGRERAREHYTKNKVLSTSSLNVDPASVVGNDDRDGTGNVSGSALFQEQLMKWKTASKIPQVTEKLLEKLLILLENFRLEDIVGRDNYKILSGLFLAIADIGYQTRGVLIQKGSVFRIGQSLLAIHPTTANARLPSDTFSKSIHIMCILIRSSNMWISSTSDPNRPLSPPPLSPFAYKSESFLAGRYPIDLHHDDLSSFLNRVLLEDAIPVMPLEVSLAIQHISWSRKGKESAKILEFLGEKILEFVNTSPGLNSGTLFNNYKPFFSVLSDVLLNDVIDINLAFDGVLTILWKKAESCSLRPSKYEADFVYSLQKLMLGLGTKTAAAHSRVLKAKSLWGGMVRGNRNKGSFR